ncbi:DENN domain protein [Dictyocaulus viviparus]|uniref:DENN domain protein n=1 Tax=Dictyocaulus viviparus TaxID=29172 RepID=A0A0D8XE07_DICVI|nr:DENN domain protein [Dictyocaulus viviparus]
MTDIEENGAYPAVLVIISPIRNAVFYLDLARTILKYIGRSRLELTNFLSSIVQHSYPQNRGASLVVVEKCTTGWPVRIEIFNQGTILGRTGCSQVIERISPEITTCIIAALLGEQRILLADNTVCSVSKLVQVMEALIQPLCWPHVFIPAVPDNLLDLCHNPTPYLMGILRNNLAPIHDLIIANHTVEIEVDQVDFVFIDADNGLINPPPQTYMNNGSVAAWKQQSAVNFCQRLGMPKKASMALITGLRSALADGSGPAADLRIENIMLVWYASLFGHYRAISCHCEWGPEFKLRLVDSQPDKTIRPYLSYLCETVMFHEWIVKRCSKAPEPADPLPGSEEFLNRRIDKLYLAGVNCFSTKPLTKMINKVTNALRTKK